MATGKLPSAEVAIDKGVVLEPVSPPPMSKKELMDKMEIGSSKDVTPAERRKIERDMKMASEPIKKAKGGSASSRADGCCKRGKTRGKMV